MLAQGGKRTGPGPGLDPVQTQRALSVAILAQVCRAFSAPCASTATATAMARELRTFVDVIQDADEHNRTLFQELMDENETLQRTIDSMETRAKKLKTWRKKLVGHARRQKHLLKNKNKTIADMTEHDKNQQALYDTLMKENQKLHDGMNEMKLYVNEHACVMCGGTVYCDTRYPAPCAQAPVPMTNE